jgi:hypothetical protein
MSQSNSKVAQAWFTEVHAALARCFTVMEFLRKPAADQLRDRIGSCKHLAWEDYEEEHDKQEPAFRHGARLGFLERA